MFFLFSWFSDCYGTFVRAFFKPFIFSVLYTINLFNLFRMNFFFFKSSVL